MAKRATFKSTKGRRITIFEIIHQGPQDTIIFHIQNKKVGVNCENFQCYSYGASLWNSQKSGFCFKTQKRTSFRAKGLFLKLFWTA